MVVFQWPLKLRIGASVLVQQPPLVISSGRLFNPSLVSIRGSIFHFLSETYVAHLHYIYYMGLTWKPRVSNFIHMRNFSWKETKKPYSCACLHINASSPELLNYSVGWSYHIHAYPGATGVIYRIYDGLPHQQHIHWTISATDLSNLPHLNHFQRPMVQLDFRFQSQQFT